MKPKKAMNGKKSNHALARTVVVILLSVGIAWSLSFLPNAAGEHDSLQEQTVFQPDHPILLTTDNLVDGLVKLPLTLSIARADLHQSVLAIDLWFPGGLAGAQTVYHDLYELTEFAWRSTSNVDRVQFRVLEAGGSGPSERQLLVAMEGRRKEASAREPSERVNVQEYLQNQYDFTYTQKWKDRN